MSHYKVNKRVRKFSHKGLIKCYFVSCYNYCDDQLGYSHQFEETVIYTDYESYLRAISSFEVLYTSIRYATQMQIDAWEMDN